MSIGNTTRRIVIFRANNSNDGGFVIDSSYNLEPITNIMNSINNAIENKFKELESMSNESIRSILMLPEDYNFNKLSKGLNEIEHKGYIYYDPFILLYKFYTYIIYHIEKDVCKYRGYTISKLNGNFYITNKNGIVLFECKTSDITKCLDIIDIVCGDNKKHI